MYLFMFARLMLLLAALNYALTNLLKIDLITYMISNKNIQFTINILIVFIVSMYLFNRDYYLPFLGPTVIPIKEREIVGKLTDVQLTNLPPNTRVLYWAASGNEADTPFSNPVDAYSGYGNSGLAKTDENGKVIIRINCPSDYYVSKFGMNKKLSKHVHYRIESTKYPGLFSSVKTKYIKC